MDNAFKYIKANGGIDTEASYPYEAVNDRCRFQASEVGADDTGKKTIQFKRVPKVYPLSTKYVPVLVYWN